MKRKRLNPVLRVGAAVALGVAGIAVLGCDALAGDREAFFGENTCNVFNCDTLFFLEGEHDAVPEDHDASETGDSE